MFEKKNSMPSTSITLSGNTNILKTNDLGGIYYGTSSDTKPHTNPIFNTQPITMEARQVKVAIFSVTRDFIHSNKILHSKFMKEIWVEVPANISLELVVAKELGEELNPLTTVVKEIYSISF